MSITNWVQAKQNSPDWQWHRWTDLLVYAYKEATLSPDPSSQNGALVFDQNGTMLSAACNEFPKGLNVTPEMLERPLKYTYIEHAERNAIYKAFQHDGLPYLMVCPWAACADCARAIVQSGISVLVRHKQASDRSPERWLESIAVADDILKQCRVRVIDIDAPSLGAPTIRHCEELWTP